jgi:FKBP-type peptidyl-prolyl cis-trans isomerase
VVDGGKQQEFEVADGSLVPGFIEGVQGMCVREHRTITVPPSLGYGSKGLKKVPPDTTIIFEVFLVSVKKASVSIHFFSADTTPLLNSSCTL